VVVIDIIVVVLLNCIW